MAGSLNISREQKEDTIVQILEDACSIEKIEKTYRYIRIKDVSQNMDFSTCMVKGEWVLIVSRNLISVLFVSSLL